MAKKMSAEQARIELEIYRYVALRYGSGAKPRTWKSGNLTIHAFVRAAGSVVALTTGDNTPGVWRYRTSLMRGDAHLDWLLDQVATAEEEEL